MQQLSILLTLTGNLIMLFQVVNIFHKSFKIHTKFHLKWFIMMNKKVLTSSLT